MILRNLCFYSQNIWKNKFFTDNILETKKYFHILFIQELPWTVIHSILSFTNKEGDQVVNTPYHPNWFTFSKSLTDDCDHPRVITYINIRLVYLYFSLRKNIFNHRDINCFPFFNNGSILFMINFKVSQEYWS